MKHNLLKSVIISVILLMGVSNAWAGDPYISGFGLQFRDDGGTWFKTGTKGDGGIMDLDLGSKTNLKIVYIYANGDKNGGNLCDNNYFKYAISGTTQTENWGGTKHSNVDWTTPTYKWGTENSQNAFIDLVQNRKPGNYSMEFIFSVEGNSNSNYCGNWYDCKYSNGNWKFTWSIPDPTITITGANALVVGTSTNIKASMSNYPIGSTISKIQVSGNTTSKSATGSTDNLTVSSVTPNASGKNGITVTVTVKFGTGGTKDYTYTYNVTPPAVNNFKVTASNVVSGTGTSGDPYVIACGKTTTLTVSGSKASTDANSSLYAKFGSDAYTSTLTKNLTPSSTKQSVQVQAKYYNSKDNLSGAETTTQTIYYRAQTFAVNIISSGNGTVTPSGTQQVGATNFNITATPEIGSAFKHWEVTGGAKVANATSATTIITATSAGTVKAVFEEKPATTIYLEPTGYWNSHNPQYVAHVWIKNNTSVNEDIIMTGVGEAPHKYYKAQVPYGYTEVVFFRKKSDGSEFWNQTGDLTIPTDNKTLYVITDNTTSPATGVWKEANLVYTITLGYCEFGTYGIKYNGQSYFSKQPNENVTIDVPAGAQIEILEGQPHSNAYTGDVIKSKPTKEELTIGQTLTINGDITLDDNFKTKTSHVVYLGVPDGLTDWTSGTYDNFLWSWNTMSSFSLIASTRNFKIANTTYYEYTIPAGRHSLCFQRKTGVNDNGTPQKESVYLPFQIPLTDVNCFTLKNEKDGNRYKGTWGVLPAQTDDYRLLYIEQKVTLEDGHPKTTVTKAHPSDIIRKNDTRTKYSLHIYNKVENGESGMNDPEILVQRWDGSNWITTERHMVFGPLHADFGMAAMPGRRNADGDPDAVLRYDDGIENIKNDTHADNGSGVWNFIVTREGNNFTGLNLTLTERYEGEYYIRTDNTEGGWDQYTLNDNYMTYSQYAKDHSGFSHYFCRWVEVSKGKNTKFVIANDYGIAISDTLAQDDYTNEQGDIAHDANIRWSWNEATNEIARAYIQGTWDANTSTRNENLVVNYKSSSSAADATDLLDDSGDWIYQKDFPVKVGSHLNSLTAQYPVSTGDTQTFASDLDMLTGDPANTNEYKVRILYDFKINKTLVALVPDNGKQADIAIDVIIERVDQGEATQVQAPINAARTAEGSTVYAVMSFTKDHITGGASKYAKQFYWISFPFDVRVSDVFGFGEYGKHWIIQWYDGAERAKNGCWIDSPTYWRFQTDTTDYVLEAGKGYVLTLDLAEMDVFTNTNQVSLYFPSRQTVRAVDGEIIHDLNTTTLAPYTCTIQRNERYIKDSHWHMLGVPSYANKNKSFTQNDVAYFYTYDSSDDTYDVTSSGSFNFNSMFSYMVQFAGTINWSQFAFDANGSQGLAAKRNTDNANDKHVLRLELQKNNASVDQTFVQLQAEEATEMFDMNLDLTKMVNSGNNIYSLIPGTESNIEVAANAMPIKETIIPLGVKITAAGEYTFAMPDGTDGIVVELIDYEANTTTNLLFNDYTVSLPKGTFENRFALSVKPDKTATSLENIFNEATGDEVKKFIIDGVLYMQKDGVLYDAQGHIVR